MAQPNQQANSAPTIDCSGLLITYLDEEVDDTWVVHPRHALRMNHLTDEERRLFDNFSPKVHRQDKFFEVLDKARKEKERDLPNEVLGELIEDVLPDDLPTVQNTGNRTKKCRLSSRAEPALDTRQHLLRKLRSQKYFGTKGMTCGLCGVTILHHDDLKRHLKKQHPEQMSETKKTFGQIPVSTSLTRESWNLPPTISSSGSSRARSASTSRPQSIIINESPNATIIIGDNRNPPSSDETFVQRQRVLGANMNRHRPYPIYRQPLSQPPMSYDSWSHDTGVSGSTALTALQPNVFPPAEPFAQFPGLESGSNQQYMGGSWTGPPIPFNPTVVPYQAIPLAPFQPMNNYPIHPPSSILPTVAPSPGPPWVMPTPVFHQAPIGPSSGTFVWGNRTPSDSRCALKNTRSSDEQWEGRLYTTHWCSPSDLKSRLANALQPVLFLSLTAGILVLVLFTLSISLEGLEEHATDIQLLTLTF